MGNRAAILVLAVAAMLGAYALSGSDRGSVAAQKAPAA